MGRTIRRKLLLIHINTSELYYIAIYNINIDGASVLNFEMNCCPNPKCQKRLEKIIIVYEDSTNTKFSFACSHCGFKLDPTKTQLLKKEKKEEKVIEEKTETNQTQTEKEIPSGCPKYLGYLSVKSENSTILMECLACSKMANCMLETN